jgi:hypothetical protein
MADRITLIKTIGSPDNKAVLVNSWQNVDDIIKVIMQQHAENLKDAKKICKYFKGNSEKETAKNVFNFLKNEIEYKVEPAAKQTSKTLKRFLADGFGDCKHFSNFTGTIMQACGYNVTYRFAGYNGKDLQHVYNILPDSKIVVDAVLPYFDTEKTYSKKKDIKMAMYKLSGTNEEDIFIGGLYSNLKTGFKKVTTGVSNAVKKAADAVAPVAQKVVQGTKTVSLAIPRGAFTGLILLNVRGWATKFKTLIDRKGEFEALKWWFELGGNRTELRDAIFKGASKKALLAGFEEENASRDAIFDGYSGDGVYIGVEPVTTAAALATATPIIIKAVEVLKSAGIDVEQAKEIIKTGTENFEKLTGNKLENTLFKKDEGVKPATPILNTGSVFSTKMQDAIKVARSAAASATGTSTQAIAQAEPITTAFELTLPDARVTASKFNWKDPKVLIPAGIIGAFLIYKAVKK